MTDTRLTDTAPGAPMPMVIYGTAWKEARTADCVEQAVTLGFRGIDTACQPKHYNEAGVGDGLARCYDQGRVQRQDIYLQSKFTPFGGQDPARLPYDPDAPLAEQVAQSFATSQRNLRTTYLDSLVLHSPLADPEQLREVWQGLEAIADHGGARRLGISNCYSLDTLAGLHEWARIKPSIVQNRFYADTGYDRAIRAFCRERQVVYQSFWTLTANPRVLAHPRLTELAARLGRTAAQVFFRFVHETGIVPLSGTTSADHMREDLAIAAFSLTAADRDAIERLLDDATLV